MCAIQQSAALIAERGGILYVSGIETQQLQLARHAVGVFKGGVAADGVSEYSLPLRATHTSATTHTHARSRTRRRVSPSCKGE